MLEKLSPYNKTVAAVVIGLIGWASAVVTSDRATISASEWIALATVVAQSVGVYQVTNKK